MARQKLEISGNDTHEESHRFELFKQQFPVYGPLPIWILIVIYVAMVILFLLSYASLLSFPTPLLVVDEPRHPDSFLSENAYEHIKYLAEDIGYRITGHPNNEISAVNYIKGQVRDIMETASPNLTIELRHDIMSGVLPRKGLYRMTNVYRGIQNIVVKLSPNEVNPNHSYILLNAHFDTVPLSPGAGDDATMVGVMLELLRVFSRKQYVNHPVIFLFNGCEENGLAGAHAFLTQNPWYGKVGVLLNLDVSGAGGKELMFQTAPQHPWLMSAYANSAPNAFATSTAEEMYQNGFIQSDTDFTVFKNFGDNLPAMDFAQMHDCYSYHTKYDDINAVKLGALQHTGDNMVALIKEMDVRREPDNYLAEQDEEGAKFIFYDFLGLFLIFYSQELGTILNTVLFVVLTVIIGFCVYKIKNTQGVKFRRVLLEYGIALLIQCSSAVLAFSVCLFIAWILDACERSMSWYTNVWLIFGIYFCPFYLCNSLLPYFYIKYRERKEQISTSYYVQMAIHAHCNLICVILIVMTFLRIKSAYMALLSTMFYFFSTILNIAFNFINKGNKWLYLHCFSQILPTLYYFYVAVQSYITMVPIGARAYDGSQTNPDILIAILTGMITLLGTGFWAPIIVMFKHRKLILGSFLGVFVIFIIVVTTPVGFPYREEISPQRYTIWQTKREFFDYNGNLRKADSGYYVYGYDRHGASTLLDKVPLMSKRVRTDRDCSEEMMCGQPWFRVQYIKNADYNYWIPAEPPLLPTVRPKLQKLGTTPLSHNRTKYDFTMMGPAYMNIQLSPLEGAELVEWSFNDELVVSAIWNNRKVYFINYIHGVSEFYYKDYEFSLTFEVPDDWTQPYVFDIGHSAMFIHDEEYEKTKTQEFIEFLDSFPRWTNVQNWTAYYTAYEI